MSAVTSVLETFSSDRAEVGKRSRSFYVVKPELEPVKTVEADGKVGPVNATLIKPALPVLKRGVLIKTLLNLNKRFEIFHHEKSKNLETSKNREMHCILKVKIYREFE